MLHLKIRKQNKDSIEKQNERGCQTSIEMFLFNHLAKPIYDVVFQKER